MVNNWFEHLLDRAFPGRCRCCLNPGIGGLDLCASCYRELPRLRTACQRCAEPLFRQAMLCGHCLSAPPAFSIARVPFLFQPPVSLWISQLKYSGELAAGRLLGRLLARSLSKADATVDALVPVPLHRGRLRERGFNQAREIARELHRKLGLPILDGALRRTRSTPHQTALPRMERRRNMRRAFTATQAVDGLRIALVDDVVTTGSTADAAAAALREAGAAEVEVWAVARTPKDP
ncbi:ComF family protein [Methylonatrum kenyense]|uniref:ComF family protein n=1 Tax=Methylonatrum kenyense TaxID=455253 RepID=UPI0020BD901E|nr:ComF family protein [Methylonatrum kenyense]MCK8516908.1 ComF family protein [Methylonatrum kenyense]